MKIFKIYNACRMGFESDVSYCLQKDKALQHFNELIRKELSSVDVVNKEDFSEEVSYTRKSNEGWNLVCRKYPLIIFEKEGTLVAHIPFWEATFDEYSDSDVISNSIFLEELEVVE